MVTLDLPTTRHVCDLRESFAARSETELMTTALGIVKRWSQTGTEQADFSLTFDDGSWQALLDHHAGSFAVGVESTLHAALVSMLVDLFEDDDDRPELVNEWAEPLPTA